MAKLDRIKKQYPELDISLLDIIASVDPSQTKKYVEFLIKQIIRGYLQSGDEKILNLKLIAQQLLGVDNTILLEVFDEHYKNNRIRIKDISLYHTLDDMKCQVDEANEIVKRKELEKQTIKLYQDKEWLVIVPTSYEASQVYASNTKWCITVKSYWNDYKKHSRIIFVINRKTDEKYAISKRFSNYDNSPTIQGWDAKDNEVSPFMWEFTDEIWKVLRNDLKKTKLHHELDELEEGMIRINNKGDVVKLEEANLVALEWFYKRYVKCLQEPFLSQVVEKGKILRGDEESKKKKPAKVSNNELEELYDYVTKSYDSPEKIGKRMEDYGYTKYIGEEILSYLNKQILEENFGNDESGKKRM